MPYVQNKEKLFKKFEDFVISKGYVLKSTLEEYENAQTSVQLVCPNNHQIKTTPNRFKSGHGCSLCSKNNQKITKEEVESRCNTKNLTLINFDNYVNWESTFEVQCNICSTRFHKTLGTLKNYGCKTCSYQEKTISYDYIENFLKKLDFKLLTSQTEYTDTQNYITVECINCQDQRITYFYNIKDKCNKCTVQNSQNIRKDTITSEILDFFNTYPGFILLSYEVGTTAKEDLIEAKCNRGHDLHRKFETLRKNPVCSYCQKTKEENLEKEIGFRYANWTRSGEAKAWAVAVKKRDNKLCQACLIPGGSLHSHHIINFSQNERLANDIDNGITLHASCHIEFHNKYGKQNNTKEQLNEFIQNKRLEVQQEDYIHKHQMTSVGYGSTYTYEQVKQKFEEKGYRLISTTYIDSLTDLESICPNGHKRIVNLTQFQISGCAQCSYDKQKLPHDTFLSLYKNKGYILKDTKYLGFYKAHEFFCIKGQHKSSISPATLKRGNECQKCATEKTRTPFEEVEKTFLSEGYIIQDPQNYVKTSSKLQVKCPKGHIKTYSYSTFLYTKTRCSTCYSESVYQESKNSIKEYLEVNNIGFTLVENSFLNKRKPFYLQCTANKDHQIKVYFSNFVKSKNKQCDKCDN